MRSRSRSLLVFLVVVTGSSGSWCWSRSGPAVASRASHGARAEALPGPPRSFPGHAAAPAEPEPVPHALAFNFAGEIWTVPVRAHRPATDHRPARQRAALFSPDGTQIAFTGTYERNADVYVVPAAGRAAPLDLSPRSDVASAGHPTAPGSSSAPCAGPSGLPKLFTVSVKGGAPKSCRSTPATRRPTRPTASGSRTYHTGSSSRRGRKYARADDADLDRRPRRLRITKIPRQNSNDRFPCGPATSLLPVRPRRAVHAVLL